MPPSPSPPGHLWEKPQESNQEGIGRAEVLLISLLMQKALQFRAEGQRDQGSEKTQVLNQGIHCSIKRISS